MRKTLTLILLSVVFTISACGTKPLPALTSVVTTEMPLPTTETPTETVLPTEAEQQTESTQYQNDEFGLSFHFPSTWFGPEEYVSEEALRVEIGSDRVYPYGSSPETRVYNGNNSYSIIFQYTLNNQNDYWLEDYNKVLTLADGESISDSRSLIIKVREFRVGIFTGVEYIATLSETAQTEHVYIRQIYLVDDQSNLISIMGSPNNVSLTSGADWREVYKQIDEAFVTTFHDVVNSISIVN